LLNYEFQNSLNSNSYNNSKLILKKFVKKKNELAKMFNFESFSHLFLSGMPIFYKKKIKCLDHLKMLRIF
jgi:hypothetical protein